MTTQSFKRKLTAILSADVKGYSRLMGEDEDATVHTLKAYRELIGNLIHKYHGRVVDSPGDNILSEFASVVDALRSAVAIQEELKAKNTELPENRRMEFRIGINLGDVIEDEGRIYGDGVNIAARIEGLSQSGGICISRTAYDHVKNKLSLGYEYIGEHAVKNIADPVKVYRVLMEPEAAGKVIGEKRARPRRRQWPVVASVILVLGFVAVAIWNFYLRSALFPEKGSSVKKASISETEKPSIAVLPFKNLSGNPEQEYFSDGITNDIITDLSKFRELSVIASNTVFTYKDKPVKIKDVSRDLGVRYVLEGSVQKTGGKVRINSQLIDATTGHHLWAERYDKDLKDLFKLQDELVQTIVSKLAIQIRETERGRVMRKDTDNLKAYDYLLRGREYIYQNTREGNKDARLMFERAIEIDPRYSSAYATLAWTHIMDFFFGWTMFPDKSLQRADDLAKKALSLEESNALAHSALGSIYLRRTKYDLAISELQRAIELNPNDTQSQSMLGSVMLYSGRKDEAIYWKESALRLNPHPYMGLFMTLAQAYYLNGRYEDAITILKKGLAKNPDYVGNHIVLAAAYAQAGFTEEAKRSAAKVLRLDPFFELDSYGTVFRSSEDRAKIVQGLRKAGLK
ncbi:MAG: tetratricopeptide repeat protein [Desulfobacterales bacterium]